MRRRPLLLAAAALPLAARAQAVLDEIDREAASKREAIATMFGGAKPESGKPAGRTRKASNGDT